MISRMAAGVRRARRDERGGDTIWTMLFIIPFMLILIFLMVDLGIMFATRYAVTNVLRDTVRQVASYGSDCGPGECPFAPPPANNGVSFSSQAESRLNAGEGGRCTFGPCTNTEPIQVLCGRADANGTIYPGQNARYVGDWIGCELAQPYPYKGVTGGVLNTDLAAGFGGLVSEFPVKVLGRSETGDNPSID